MYRVYSIWRLFQNATLLKTVTLFTRCDQKLGKSPCRNLYSYSYITYMPKKSTEKASNWYAHAPVPYDTKIPHWKEWGKAWTFQDYFCPTYIYMCQEASPPCIICGTLKNGSNFLSSVLSSVRWTKCPGFSCLFRFAVTRSPFTAACFFLRVAIPALWLINLAAPLTTYNRA